MKGTTKKKERITLAEALANLPPAKEWFKLTSQEKRAFERMRLSDEMSKKMGFTLGGSFDPKTY